MKAEEIVNETLRLLRHAVRDGDKSQGEIAAEIGIEPGTLSRYLNNRRELPYPIFVKICEATGVEPMQILAEVDRHAREQSK